MNIDNFSTPNRNQYVLKRYGSNIAVTFAKTEFEADGIDYNLTNGNVGVNIDPPLLVTGKITNIGNVGNAGNVSDYQGKLFYYYVQNTQTQGEEPVYPPPVSGSYWRYNGYGGRTVTPAQSGQFLPGTGDFTFEFFFKKENSMNNQGQFGFGYPNYNTKNWIIRDNYGYPLEFFWTDGSSNYSLPLCTDNSVFDNSFAHVAVVRVNGVLKSFCNGVSISTNSNAEAATSFDNSYDFKIGAADGQGNYSTQNFSNVRYVIGSGLYNANFEVPNPPLQIVNASGTRLLITGFGNVDSSLWGATIDYPPDYSGTTAIVVVDNPYA